MSAFQQENHHSYKEAGKFKVKMKTETVPEKDLIVYQLDNDLKTIIIQMLKEPKEDVKKVKKQCKRKIKYQ